MSEWMKSFVGYLLIISVALQMLPNSKYEQYVRLFTGLLLIVLMIQPILKIGSADSYLEEKISAVVAQQERLEQEILTQSQAFEEESQCVEENASGDILIQEIEQVQVEVTMDD